MKSALYKGGGLKKIYGNGILAGHFQPGRKHANIFSFSFSAFGGSQASQNRGGGRG